MRIDFHKNFDRQFKRQPLKVRARFKQQLVVFAEDKYTIGLRNHGLRGKYSGYRSINVTGDIRAIFIEHNDDHVEFVSIGTHSQLYK